MENTKLSAKSLGYERPLPAIINIKHIIYGRESEKYFGKNKHAHMHARIYAIMHAPKHPSTHAHARTHVSAHINLPSTPNRWEW